MLKSSHEEKEYVIKFGELYLATSNTKTITFTGSPYGAYVFKKEHYKEDDEMMRHLIFLLKELSELGFKNGKIIEIITKVEKYEQEIKETE